MSVGVIIVAAGRGVRAGGAIPKQFEDLGGRTMLRRSVEAFDGHPDVGELVVVLPAELVSSGGAVVGATRRRCRIVGGGPRRQDSVAAGFHAVSAEADVVLVHDAARPFVDPALIGRVVEGARTFGAAVPAVPASDTVKRATRDRVVSQTLPRDEIWLAQTPQGFRRAVLADAVERGASGVAATDEAMLAEAGGQPVRIVDGDPGNVKITTGADLALARARFAGSAPRVGTGYDLHRLADGRPLLLAGVVVSAERGPIAHSDGDVVSHAAVDALLGAIGAGDIGTHFPNTDPAWKDAAGLDLLARAVAVASARGWQPASLDVTVVLERPKIATHVAEIRARLAEVLGVPPDAVSVKGKTNEGVDAVGRGEAIAAHAVAVVVPAAR
jgi:2-C-methyl-D-erythritol 4-phosphate cytidylyltransferase/2-C-methyl-D-erythritol 2,4-cyclodiphosphate synthase